MALFFWGGHSQEKVYNQWVKHRSKSIVPLRDVSTIFLNML